MLLFNKPAATGGSAYAAPLASQFVVGVTTSPGINSAGGNLLLVASGTYNALPSSVTDNKGNTPYTLAVSDGSRTTLWFYQGGTVGSGHTFSLGGSGIGYASMSGIVFQGAAVSPLDQTSISGSGTPGSITPTQDNELIITVAGIDNPGGILTIDSGFTVIGEQNWATGSNIGHAVAYLIQGAKAPVNPTWSGCTNVGSIIASFKSA